MILTEKTLHHGDNPNVDDFVRYPKHCIDFGYAFLDDQKIRPSVLSRFVDLKFARKAKGNLTID